MTKENVDLKVLQIEYQRFKILSQTCPVKKFFKSGARISRQSADYYKCREAIRGRISHHFLHS